MKVTKYKTEIYNNNNLSFYIDNNKDNTNQYLIFDNSDKCYYSCKVDTRKDNLVLKFVLYAIYKVSNNLTKCNFNRFENIINNDNKMNIEIDFNRLYLR